MADISIGRIVRRGVAGTIDPRGRDDRVQFWIYFAIVLAPLIAVQMAFRPTDSRPNPGMLSTCLPFCNAQPMTGIHAVRQP